MSLLSIRNLKVTLRTPQGPVYPVQGADIEVKEGQTRCLVGESGCGKSLSMLAVMGLLPAGASIEAEQMHFAGQDLRTLTAKTYRRLRGPGMGLIFQDAMAAFNPVLRIGDQLAEAYRTHRGGSRRVAWQKAVHWLDRVGILQPEDKARYFPHEFSGGMLQRAMIAMTLITQPRLVIADEPTTALDVSVQAQILALLRDLQRSEGVGLILITHDLGVVAEMADDVSVLYAGKTIEEAPAKVFFDRLSHPYSQGLMACTPNWRAGPRPVEPIPGLPPPLNQRHQGCAFRYRCASAMQICDQLPQMQPVGERHRVACWLTQRDQEIPDAQTGEQP